MGMVVPGRATSGFARNRSKVAASHVNTRFPHGLWCNFEMGAQMPAARPATQRLSVLFDDHLFRPQFSQMADRATGLKISLSVGGIAGRQILGVPAQGPSPRPLAPGTIMFFTNFFDDVFMKMLVCLAVLFCFECGEI